MSSKFGLPQSVPPSFCQTDPPRCDEGEKWHRCCANSKEYVSLTAESTIDSGNGLTRSEQRNLASQFARSKGANSRKQEASSGLNMSKIHVTFPDLPTYLQNKLWIPLSVTQWITPLEWAMDH